MPYPIPVGALIEIRIVSRLDAQLVETTWHYQYTSSSSPDGALALRTLILPSFEAKVWTPIQQATCTTLTGTRLTAQMIFPTRYVAEVITPTVSSGAEAPPAAPSGVAFVIRRRSIQAGRAFRGRVYVPGLAAARIVASQLTPGFIAAHKVSLENAGRINLDLVVADDIDSVILHRTAPLTATLIETAELDAVVRYQRRREVGVGV